MELKGEKYSMRTVKVEAPATIANLGPCFDVLGIALTYPRDVLTLSLIEDSDEITIEGIEGLKGNSIPKLVGQNTAGLAAKVLLSKLELKVGLKINIKKGIRAASGMGSSGASAAGVVYGISKLLERSIDNTILIEAAAEGERAAANTAHADNVAAAILGGIVVLRSHVPLDFIRFQVPEKLTFAIVLPELELVTAKSRSVLPLKLKFADSVSQMGSCAYLIAALVKGDLIKIGKAVNSDYLVEPARAALIRGFKEVKQAALKTGAYGCSICGGGPSIFAVCDRDNQESVLGAMGDALKNLDIKFNGFKSYPSNEGSKVVK